jgi:Ca-activated chloride channel family protein
MGDWGGSAFVWRSGPAGAASLGAVLLASLGFLCAVIALAGPEARRKEKVFTSLGTDILFVLDTSPSMAARDINAGGWDTRTRFEAARAAIGAAAEKDYGQAGILTFASEAALASPVTVDREFFSARLGEITLGALGDSSSIGTGLALAVYHLASTGGQKKCIVLFTDGENNAGFIHPLTAAALARDKGITLYVAGIGARGRAPLEYRDPKTGRTLSGFLDSRFDEGALRELAAEGGGRYFSVTTLGELGAALEAVALREGSEQSFYYRVETRSFRRQFIAAALGAAALAWVIKRLVLGEAL